MRPAEGLENAKKRGFEKHLCEHNKTFKNEGGILECELDLNIFSMPFNVDCEQVKPSLQLELIELQCSTQLK
jgi:hypothetical protein